METFLIVDDNQANRDMLRQMLEIQGHAVIEASNGFEAIELFKQQAPDLVLMDIMMPGMDGHEAVREIKALDSGHYTPVIYVTAKHSESALPTALEAGGDDFINKPVDFNVLQAKASAHLRIRELNRKLDENNAILTRQNHYLAHQQELIDYFFENALQQSFLDPAIVRHHISPMSAFNGDVLLAERGPHGGLYVLMGDFTGHGLTAAMGTLPVAQVFFKMTRKGLTIAEIAREINFHLSTLLPLGMFFAATLLELNPAGQHLNIWSGGMPRTWWLDDNGTLKGTIPSFHMPLGILSDAEFDASTQSLAVDHGDRFYLCSDGLTEASGANGEQFGEQRLEQALITGNDDRFKQVLDALESFRGDQGQQDDISFIEVTCQAIGAATPTNDPGNPADILPWRMTLRLNSNQLRSLDPVGILSDLLDSQAPFSRHKGAIQTLLSELYSNALEHGLLGLESGMKIDEEQFVAYYRQREQALAQLQDGEINMALSVSCDQQGGLLQIRVSHNGQGFREAAPAADDEALSGRGLSLIKALCERVSIRDEGRTTEVSFRLQ